MSQAKKLYTAKLKGHTEEWTQEEHDAVQAMTGDRFAEYEVTAIQPDKPSDVPVRTRTTPNAEAPAA